MVRLRRDHLPDTCTTRGGETERSASSGEAPSPRFLIISSSKGPYVSRKWRARRGTHVLARRVGACPERRRGAPAVRHVHRTCPNRPTEKRNQEPIRITPRRPETEREAHGQGGRSRQPSVGLAMQEGAGHGPRSRSKPEGYLDRLSSTRSSRWRNVGSGAGNASRNPTSDIPSLATTVRQGYGRPTSISGGDSADPPITIRSRS